MFLKTTNLSLLCVLCVLSGGTVSARAGGLDSLDDDRLLSELASRGLNTLLEHAFEAQQVPQERREAIRALAAMRELERADAAMPPNQRREMVRHVVAGIERILPTMNDPRGLMQHAAVLIRHAVEPDVNTLEYWGENVRLQQELRPVVEAVRAMLDRAADAAETAADRLAEQLSGPDDPRIEQWIELDALATNAAYTRRMIDYALVLSMPAEDPSRGRVADEAVEYLRQFDDAESEVQPIVREVRYRLACLESVP
jgi:hypothetical protein